MVVPLLLATNFWYVKHLFPYRSALTLHSIRQAREFPAPTSAGLYNSTFQHFDVMAVLNEDLSLNDEAWENAKPLLLTPYL